MLISRNLMSRKPISQYLLLAATALLLSGCANRPTPLATSLKSFQPSKANPNQMVYQEPGTDLKKYHAVMIDPPALCPAPGERQADLPLGRRPERDRQLLPATTQA